MAESNELYLLQEFPGGRQTFGLASSTSGVFFADSEGRSVGRIDRDGLLTVLKLPRGSGRPHGLAATDDEIWLAEWSNQKGNRVSRLSGSGDSYDFLDLDGFGTPRNVVVSGGEVFFTVGSKLGRLRSRQEQVELHAFPGETGWRRVESTPLAVDAHGGVWVGFGGSPGYIARFDPRDDTWESLEIGDLLPIDLAIDPDGNDLWFTDFNHSQIGRVTQDRSVERWEHPGNPFGVAVGQDGNVWVADFAFNRLTRINPESRESIQTIDLPTADSQPQNLTFDALGALWYTGQRGVVGRYGPPIPMPALGEQVEVALNDPPVRLKDLARTGRGLSADLPPDPAPICVSFSAHSSFTPPPTEVVIWRYVDLPKLVSMLASRSLFFARLDKQPDRFEGSLPQHDGSDLNFDQLTSGGLGADQLREFMKMQRESLGIFRPRALVSCWHMNDHESMAMWDLYAQAGSGIAIRSTSRSLVESLHHENTSERFLPPAYLGAVRYIDYATAVVVPSTPLEFLTLKRTSFAHERELRAVVLSDNRVQGGQNIACNIEALVESIYVAPGSPGWFRDAVQQVVNRFDVGRNVKQSDLDIDPVL
jgi:streptogramin lyase